MRHYAQQVRDAAFIFLRNKNQDRLKLKFFFLKTHHSSH